MNEVGCKDVTCLERQCEVVRFWSRKHWSRKHRIFGSKTRDYS